MRKITNNEEQQRGFRINLGESWRVLWRKKYFVVVPLVIAVVVSNVGVRFLVPIFESQTVIRVENPQSGNSEVTRFLGSQRGLREAETLARLEADLKGSAFLNELIALLGMDKDPKLLMQARVQAQNAYPTVTPEELVFRRLRNFVKRRIEVDRVGPGLFSLKYWDADAEACYAIAEAMADLYIDVRHRGKIEVLREVTDFSEEQLAVYKERLNASERRLERLQKQLARQQLENNPVHENNISLTRRLEQQIGISISDVESTVEKIRTRLANLLTTVPTSDEVSANSAVRSLEDRLVTQRERELLYQLSGGATSEVVPGERMNVMEKDIFDAQRDLQRKLAVAVLEIYPNMNTDYRPLVSEYFYQLAELRAHRLKNSRLQNYVRRYREKVSQGPQTQSELVKLRADVENDRALYNSFLKSKTTTQIREAAQNTELGQNITVVEHASKPFSPVRPNKVKILALAIMFGLSIGAGGLLLTEFSDTSFRSVEEVERELGLKVLGTIPRFEKTGRWRRESSRKRAVLWVIVSMLIVVVSIFGFYFYGKSSKEQMLNVNVTTSPAPR